MFPASKRIILLVFFAFHQSVAELRSILSKNQTSTLQRLLDEFNGLEFTLGNFPPKNQINEVLFSLLDPETLLPLIELSRGENLVTFSLANDDNSMYLWKEAFEGQNFRFRLEKQANERLILSSKDFQEEITSLVPMEVSKRLRSTRWKMLTQPNISVNVSLALRNPGKLLKNDHLNKLLLNQSQKDTSSKGQESRKQEHYCEYGNYHASGSAFQASACDRCLCLDGQVTCKFESPVPCDDSTPEWLRGCCPQIDHNDFCARTPCDINANCTNLIDRADCVCKEGFTGDGKTCADVDECQFDEAAREQLGGCLVGTMCVNTPGSFRCECLPGHQRMDERNCLDVLRI